MINNVTSEGSSQKTARLRILDKEVQLSCKPGEEEDLMQAAAYIERSLRDLRQRNTTSSIEKLAIVTAINTASELLRARADASQADPRDPDFDATAIGDQLDTLTSRMDSLLDATKDAS